MMIELFDFFAIHNIHYTACKSRKAVQKCDFVNPIFKTHFSWIHLYNNFVAYLIRRFSSVLSFRSIVGIDKV